PFAGQWYPGTPGLLRQSIQNFLDAAPAASIAGRLVALVAPHAGHTFSGGVAAHAYQLVQGAHYDVVAIIAPNHRINDRAPFITTGHAAFATPLGNVPLADGLLAALDESLGLRRVRRDAEHSVEIQLPFLQVALDGPFQLLPLILNEQSPHTCRQLSETLADLLRDHNALLIASTDLSHFENGKTAARLDSAVTDRIAALDPQGLLDVLATGKGRACGGGPTVAVMLAARALGADRATLLKYATSGDVNGDYGRVVGYAAAALYAANP
ncbi:MAG: AmmeMemoRadiSam system protein B, partial [Delftia sp.]|nr:AmmeMemoRadiSam system protein B [Delftia sp.]